MPLFCTLNDRHDRPKVSTIQKSTQCKNLNFFLDPGVGHLRVYHNIEVGLFKIHPRGEKISLSGTLTIGNIIEFDGLSHHIGTKTYILYIYIEK